jgi:hypothetical protein
MPEQEQAKLTVLFKGLEADKGDMPLSDLLTSLEGWHDFVQLAATSFFHHRLTVDPLPPEQRLTINVQSVKPTASVEVSLVLWAEDFNTNVAAGLVTVGIVGLAAMFFQWVASLYKGHVQPKRIPDETLEQHRHRR